MSETLSEPPAKEGRFLTYDEIRAAIESQLEDDNTYRYPTDLQKKTYQESENE